MDLSLLLTLAVIHAIALVSPGPDFAIMVKIATQQQRLTAIATAVGISVAIVVHTILSLTGVSFVIQSSHHLYLLVQVAGASYLAWMGWGALRSALMCLTKSKVSASAHDVTMPVAASDEVASSGMSDIGRSNNDILTLKQGFMAGFYTNLLNPKALIFFLTLFSTLMTPSVTLSTKLAAAVILLLLSMLWFGGLAVMLSKAKVQQRLHRLTPIIDAVIGAIFLSVAMAIGVNLLSII